MDKSGVVVNGKYAFNGPPHTPGQGRGYSHNKTYGNVSLYLMFNKKSLNMGPIFKKKKKKISEHGSLFPIFFFLGGLFTTSHVKNPKIVKSGLYSEKIPKNGYPFLPKFPLKMIGFQDSSGTPRPN